MSGFDLLVRVKSDPDNHDLPIHHLHGQGSESGGRDEDQEVRETIIVKDVSLRSAAGRDRSLSAPH